MQVNLDDCSYVCKGRPDKRSGIIKDGYLHEMPEPSAIECLAGHLDRDYTAIRVGNAFQVFYVGTCVFGTC